MKKKKLIVGLIIILLIMTIQAFRGEVIATSIIKGKTKKIELTDLTEGSNTPYKIKNCKASRGGIIEINKIKTLGITTALELEGVKIGTTALTITSVVKVTRANQDGTSRQEDEVMQKTIEITVKDPEDANIDSTKLNILKEDDKNYSKTIEYACNPIGATKSKKVTDSGWYEKDGVKFRGIRVIYQKENKYKSTTHIFIYNKETVSQGFIMHETKNSDITKAKFEELFKQETKKSPIDDKEFMNDIGDMDGYNIKYGKVTSSSGEDRATDNFKDDVLTNVDSYNPTGVGDDAGTSATIEKMTSKILTVISNIGIAVSVIVLAILGVKYMIGSVEEKAEYKQEMVPYLIGTFILFGITSIVRILIAFGQTINTL